MQPRNFKKVSRFSNILSYVQPRILLITLDERRGHKVLGYLKVEFLTGSELNSGIVLEDFSSCLRTRSSGKLSISNSARSNSSMTGCILFSRPTADYP
jgi:hypothetical protein